MSKTSLTIFVCTGKDCKKAWHRVCDGSVGKWLKRQVEAAGLPYKLKIVKTECMDRCDNAACLCAVQGPHASFQTGVRSADDADNILATFRACSEASPLEAVSQPSPQR